MFVEPRKDRLDTHAHRMMITFFNHYDSETDLVTNKGLKFLVQQFDDVDVEDRADVYLMLQEKLKQRGITNGTINSIAGHRDSSE
jgi:hypothetical protein